MTIRPSPSLLRLWALANAEAWFCRSDNIEPAHFWIACLKFADPAIATAMLDHGAAAEECQEQAAEAARMLSFLEMKPEDAANRRRTLRGRLLRGRPPREFPPEGDVPYLHRSESSRRLFEIAVRKAEERKTAALTPLHIAEALFDMKFASLEELPQP